MMAGPHHLQEIDVLLASSVSKQKIEIEGF